MVQPGATHVEHSQAAPARSRLACARVVRERAANFYYGLRLCPEPQRSALYAIYAWMRLGDDIVDDIPDAALARATFADFAARTRAVLEGREHLSDSEECWPALAHAVRAHAIDHAWLHAMLAGLESDIERGAIATWAELDAYCYRVGGTVGLSCCAIWGVQGDAGARARALQQADSRGRAFQLINVARDVGEDASRGRTYVPEEELARVGVTPRHLREGAVPDAACAAIVRSLATRAREHLRASAGLESAISPCGRPTLWTMTKIYAGVLERLERAPALAFVPEGKARVPTLRKAAYMSGAALAYPLVSRAWPSVREGAHA